MNTLTRTLLAAIAAPVIAASASADVIAIESNGGASEGGLGSFTGTIDWQYGGIGNTGTVEITLTNTSPLVNGGYLTAFLFNVGTSDNAASISFISATNANFAALTGGGLSGVPFGDPYMAGAGTGGSFQGGGPPSAGVGVLQSVTVKFSVTASDVAALSASSFLEGPYQYNFVVRFRGFEDGGSDKVPGQLVPGPGGLAALALLGLAGARRRRA